MPAALTTTGVRYGSTAAALLRTPGIAVKTAEVCALGGTVEAPNGTAIDISGESGDVQLNGGTIRNSVTGVRVADAGDSEIDLKAVTFENNTDDISLGNDQQINHQKKLCRYGKDPGG